MRFSRLTTARSRLGLLGLAIATATFVAGCGSDDPAPPASSAGSVVASVTSGSVLADGLESVSRDARSLIDSWRSAVSESAGVWPGYDLAAIPMALVAVGADGEVEAVVAFNHPDPQALGSPVRGFDIDGHRVAVVDQPADPDALASLAPFDFFADIGGVVTFVLVGRSGEPGMEPGTPEFVALLAHEAFHRYQFDEWVPGSLVQDVDGYDFSAENLELVLLENRILIAAYEAETLADAERLAGQFAAVRSARHSRDPRVAQDEYQERTEGSARYIEHRIGDAIGNAYTSTNHTSELVHSDDSIKDPAVLGGGIKSFFGFGRFYSSGATLLALLDRFDAPVSDVAERLRGGYSPAQILGEIVTPLGDIGEMVVAARAEHDPDNQLDGAATALAELAAAEEATDFADGDLPGATTMGFESTSDQIACLQEHGLDLSGDNITIPDDIARACFDEPDR